MTCFVKHCRNVRRLLTPESKISFHRFPTDEEAFRDWLHALDQQDKHVCWSRTKLICSDHFIPEDFEMVAHKRVLKPYAIPVLNLRQDDTKHGDNIVSAGTSLHESASESSPLPFPAVHNAEVKIESSESGSDVSEKGKQVQLEHNYSNYMKLRRKKTLLLAKKLKKKTYGVQETGKEG